MSDRSGRSLTPVVLFAIGFIAMASSVSTDMYLPSFASVAEDLNASASEVQLTLTLFFFGVGIGQLLLGPISDRRGRRVVLLISLVVFAAAATAMVFAPNVYVLMALRFVQGLAGAAGLVLSRAIAADLSHGETAAKALSFVMMVSGLGPLVAPLLGGFAHEWWGWRGALASLAAVGVLMVIVAWRVLPESLPVSRRTTGVMATVFRPFGPIARDGRFFALALGFALSFGAVMSYISASPFVGQSLLGMTPLVYSFSFALSASAMVLANLINMRIVSRVGSRRMLAIGVSLTLCGALILMLFTVTNALTAASFISGAFVLTAGCGLMLSNASALALARVPATRGSGSAFMGALQFLFGGIAAPVVGLWGEATALPMAISVTIAAVGSVVCVAIALRPEVEHPRQHSDTLGHARSFLRVCFSGRNAFRDERAWVRRRIPELDSAGSGHE